MAVASNKTSNISSNRFRKDARFSHPPSGSWHFVRRVPSEFAAIDPRGIIKHSTKIEIANDRTGRRPARVAERLNEQLERYWNGLAAGEASGTLTGYEAAGRQARALGFEYLETDQIKELPTERRLERVEAFVANGRQNEAVAAAALLGGETQADIRHADRAFYNVLHVWCSRKGKRMASYVHATR